jgi:hypothetical protein
LNHGPSAFAVAARVTQPYIPGDALGAAPAIIPSNLIVPDGYAPLFTAMLESSGTFRRQCHRLAASRRVIVLFDFGAAPPSPPGTRARAEITRTADGLRVMVSVYDRPNRIELIAHELEHVIEQLDDVDLSSKAALTSTGVDRVDESFETQRAIQVGRTVAGEVRRGG